MLNAMDGSLANFLSVVERKSFSKFSDEAINLVLKGHECRTIIGNYRVTIRMAGEQGGTEFLIDPAGR